MCKGWWIRSGVLTAAAVVLAAAPARADVIDFTNAALWGGVAGQWTYSAPATLGGVTVTVRSHGSHAPLTFNDGADVHPLCAAMTGLACHGDGLGIFDDEISYGAGSEADRLYVLFSAPVTVTGIGFLDLFGANTLVGDAAAETALWGLLLSSGADVFGGSLTGTETASSLGYAAASVYHQDVVGLYFYAAAPLSSANSDFALASLTVQSVPEPGTLLLLGMGLLAAASRARTRRAGLM